MCGGQCTADHFGVAFDSDRAKARAGAPRLFSRLHSLSLSTTFSIRKFGEDECLKLVQIWIARISLLYQLWFVTGTEKAVDFFALPVSEFKLLAELEAFVVHAEGLVRERAVQCRDILPR